MLTEVCNFVHNYFEHTTYRGSFEIVDGNIDLTGLVENGQRFRIIGSAFNDGIYTYNDGSVLYNDDNDALVSLIDETFSGTVVAMAIPKTFMDIVNDIRNWQDKNSKVVDSPYTSESWGGYSYTKATGSNGVFSWHDAFRRRLNAFRKIG